MPHDPELANRMRAALWRRTGITEKKMFGGYCWMLNGNMLCGVEIGRFMLRVGKVLEAEALARPGASPMDITGRPMRVSFGCVLRKQGRASTGPTAMIRRTKCRSPANR